MVNRGLNRDSVTGALVIFLNSGLLDLYRFRMRWQKEYCFDHVLFLLQALHVPSVPLEIKIKRENRSCHEDRNTMI